MLEVGKTYSWIDFWENCEVGKTYKISLYNDDSLPKTTPILNPDEKYLCDEELGTFFKATEFLSAFWRVLDSANTYVLGTEHRIMLVSDMAKFYECGTSEYRNYRITLDDYIVRVLLKLYGVENRETFINEYLTTLPNVVKVYEQDDDIILEIDLEECECFGISGDYTLTIKMKSGNECLMESDGGNKKGIIHCDAQDFYDFFEKAQVEVNVII